MEAFQSIPKIINSLLFKSNTQNMFKILEPFQNIHILSIIAKFLNKN